MVRNILTCTTGQESQNVLFKYTNLEANVPVPNSQQSSFNESSNSQSSQTRPGSSGFHESSHGIMTPSTTLSNKSSEERVGMGETNADMMGSGLESQDGLHSWNAPPTRPLGYQGINARAPKRTANGEIKSPQHSLPTSPVDSSQYGHSRNSSMTSRGSQIGEVRLNNFLVQLMAAHRRKY